MAQFQARVLVAGETSGEILRLAEPLSLWGGLNPETGEIVETRGGNHKVLKAWKAQYNLANIDDWLIETKE